MSAGHRGASDQKKAIFNPFAPPIDPRIGVSAHVYWETVLSKKYGSREIGPLVSLEEAALPPDEHHIRFVCISDTHEQLGEILPRIPNGDVLVHCGDFTQQGDRKAIIKFNEQLGSLPHQHKIVVAGNHDLGFEDGEDLSQRRYWTAGKGTPQGYKLLTNCTYLQDSAVELYDGAVRIYGSSWHPLSGFSFYRSPGVAIRREWDKIAFAGRVDILLTHTPPVEHNDAWIRNGEHLGCADLLEYVEEVVRPKFHVFGHIHEQYGLSTNESGSTTFINASTCDHQQMPVNDPIVFDFPLPAGEKRADFQC